MNPRQIDRFFTVVGRQLTRPARAIVTGAAAGALWGHVRPSLDIDFGIRVLGGAKGWAEVEAAVEEAKKLTGIDANYAVDIDRWGAITLLDYDRHTHPYKTFGRLNVELLDPAYWTIGKLSRSLDTDIQDVIAVLRHRNSQLEPLVRLWGRALRQSPRSVACTQFRHHVEHFLRTCGRRIWGQAFDPQRAIATFHRHASMSARKHSRGLPNRPSAVLLRKTNRGG